MKQYFFKALVGTLCLGAIIGILVIVMGLWNELTVKILATTAIIFGFSISGLCCSTIYEKEKTREMSIVGMLINIISCLYCCSIVWISYNLSDWRLVISSILLSASAAHISLLLLIDPKDKTVDNLKNGTIIMSTVIDVFFLVIIFLEVSIDWRIIAVLSILIALGTIITPIMNKLYKGESDEQPKSTPLPEDNKYTQLEQLKKLLDSNAITEEEYNEEKSKILNQ